MTAVFLFWDAAVFLSSDAPCRMCRRFGQRSIWREKFFFKPFVSFINFICTAAPAEDCRIWQDGVYNGENHSGRRIPAFRKSRHKRHEKCRGCGDIRKRRRFRRLYHRQSSLYQRRFGFAWNFKEHRRSGEGDFRNESGNRYHANSGYGGASRLGPQTSRFLLPCGRNAGTLRAC